MDVKKNIKKIFLTAMIMLSISFLMTVAQMSSVNAQATEAGQASGNVHYWFLDSLDAIYGWVNDVSPSWVNRLSEEEKESIRDYSENAESINGYLRKGVSDDVGNGYTRQIIRDAENISKGLQKFNLSEGIVVYRRIHMPLWEEVEPSHLIDAVITDNAFVSTSLYSRAGNFRGNVHLELTVPAGYCGAPIMSLAKHELEFEFLLDKGTSYVIRDVRRENGILQVSAEVLPLARKENDQLILSDEVWPDTKFTFVGDAAYLSGQSEKYIVQDQTGERWLFKVSGKPWRFDWVKLRLVPINYYRHWISLQ